MSPSNSFVLPGATLLGEVVSLVVIIAAFAIVQPLTALTTLVYLLLLGAVLFFWIAGHARKAGEVHVENAIKGSRLVLEIVGAMKEVSLRSKESAVADIVKETRGNSARARGNLYFLTQLPRYTLESGLIVGFLVVGGVAYLVGGLEQAIAAVALFALAGFRLAPAVIRFQSVLAQMVAVAESKVGRVRRTVAFRVHPPSAARSGQIGSGRRCGRSHDSLPGRLTRSMSS